MTPETRRKALRAAQKLALSLTVVGCSTASHPTAMEDAGDTVDLGTALDDAGSTPMEILDAMMLADAGADATVPSDADLWADLGSSNDAAVDGGDAVNNCVGGISAYLASADPPGSAAAREEDNACCTTIQAFVDGDGTAWGTWPDDTLRAYCCGTVFEWRSGGSCTPWGPPMPPAMPALSDDEAFV